MSDPVNLANLRELTEGDVEMERELFKEFFISSDTCIQSMADNCTDGENEAFRTSAHALKGTAVNLGAAKLGELCKYAQENHEAPAQEKNAMLDTIRTEYAAVKEFLNAQH